MKIAKTNSITLAFPDKGFDSLFQALQKEVYPKLVVNHKLDIETLMLQWLDFAKKDKKVLIELKVAAIKSCQFELAANLRAIEKQFKTDNK